MAMLQKAAAPFSYCFATGNTHTYKQHNGKRNYSTELPCR